MGPVNIIEFGMVSIMLALSIFFNALVFGDIYTAWEILTSQSVDNQLYLDSSNDVMEFYKLDEQLKNEIRKFFAFTQQSRNN